MKILKTILFGTILGLGILGASSCDQNDNIPDNILNGSWKLDSISDSNGDKSNLTSQNKSYSFDIPNSILFVDNIDTVSYMIIDTIGNKVIWEFNGSIDTFYIISVSGLSIGSNMVFQDFGSSGYHQNSFLTKVSD